MFTNKSYCNDSVTSRRPHYIRSVKRSYYKRTSIRSLRYPLNEKKDRLERRNISVIRGDVSREAGFVLLSFRLEVLTLRLEKQEIKKSLNVQT